MIIIESTKTVINTDEVARGTLIWAVKSGWDEGRPGIVTDVSEKCIRVLFLPTMQNVQRYFEIKASELESGEWSLRYSSDGLLTVISFGDDEDEESGE